ncbi:zinc finger protein 2-like isoform X1 [Leguminivora glycinivorella]|uniref:zinc finger protein 2-like isoform X1 n=1 Tax=Leguminivora glycinivorella TaxID=1035111 RepID=UPI00200C8E53|nr:zinc finger protein 2-like isoform X1 [Leguminivora glycinivorella]
MVAANAARVKKRQRDPSDYAAFPGFISTFKDVDVEKGVKRKRKKYIRKIGPPLPCPHCEKVFKTQKGLNYHVSAMHGESNPAQCKCCGKVCRNAFVLKCHVMYSHAGKEMRTLDDFNPDLYCKQCDKHFSSQRVLKQHLLGLKHTPRELYAFECDTCSKRFPDKGPLQKHIDVVHLNMKPHECPSCDKRYSRRFQVRRHIAAAHARAPRSRDHVCHVCGKAFTVVSTLREHMFSHKGERPFVCKLCPATFTYSAALFTHNRLKHLKMKCKPKKKVPKGDKVEGKRKKRDKVEGKTEKGDELEGKTEKGVELEGKVEKGDAIEGKTEEIDVDQFFNKA